MLLYLTGTNEYGKMLDPIANLFAYLALFPTPLANDFLFPPVKNDGYPRPAKSFNCETDIGELFKSICVKCGLVGESGNSLYTSHSTRHTFVYWAAICGISDEDSKRMGRWTDTKSFLTYRLNGVEDRKLMMEAHAINLVETTWRCRDTSYFLLNGQYDNEDRNYSTGQKARETRSTVPNAYSINDRMPTSSVFKLVTHLRDILSLRDKTAVLGNGMSWLSYILYQGSIPPTPPVSNEVPSLSAAGNVDLGDSVSYSEGIFQLIFY